MKKRVQVLISCFIMITFFYSCSRSDVEQLVEKASKMLDSELSTEGAASDEIIHLQGDFYAYETLNTQEQMVYDEILDTILSHRSVQRISVYEAVVLERAFEAVTADYGELFWINGYSYTEYTFAGNVTGLEFMPEYSMTQEEQQSYQSLIDQKNQEILSGISMDASDYDKVKYVFNYLVDNVEYEEDSENNQNILSVYLTGATVCQGYADTAQYLFKQLGIQSAVITGTANGAGHAWNIVLMDGSYYFFDATWGNSRYQDSDQNMEKYANYSYMAFTTEEMQKTHIITDSFPVPLCSAVEDSYFVKEGLYFTVYDESMIGKTFGDAWNDEKERVAIKFQNQTDLEQAYTTFITELGITDYCIGLSSVYYIKDDDMKVFMVQFR